MWTLKQKYAFYRKVAGFMLVIFVFELFFPTAALALTSGPSQPEFSSFEPVATTNMVNEFSGDFTYNLPLIEIPGANGGGYPLSLSYHSGASPEEESSWVGYGWTLNPGAINRSKRGFPDDYNGESVKYWNKVPANQTASIGGDIGLESWSIDLPIGVNAALRYNNYKGFGLVFGAGIQFAKGIVSLGYSVSDGQGSFSVKVNPAAALNEQKEKDTKTVDKKFGAKMKAWKKKGKEGRREAAMAEKDKVAKAREKNGSSPKMQSISLAGSNYGIFSSGMAIRPVTATKYFGGSFNISASLLAAFAPVEMGPTLGISGNYSIQRNQESNALDAFGYMYASSASESTDVMDYYTEKLNAYDKQDEYLGIPFSNADNFAISGEGIGGGFRMYNKKAGHYRPNSVNSHIVIANLGFDAAIGLQLSAGTQIGAGFQKLSVGAWTSLSTFANNEADEHIMFRFNNDPGGKIDFGSDGKQRARFTSPTGGPGFLQYGAEIPHITTTMNEGNRSMRSSYVAYHTNGEMAHSSGTPKLFYNRYAMDTAVDHHIIRSTVSDGIGEFAIFNEDGMRHVYGLPVYSRNEKNLQYDLEGVLGSKIDSNYVAYRDISDDNALSTKIGEERDSAYATTFLLTEITSSDYIDRTWDGPTEDDWGGYTRFAYNRVHGHDNKADASAWYRWRIPYTGLLYNRGELSTQRDDLGSVMCGEKEIYYVDTIETKTHFAVFRISDRLDGFGAAANNTAANSRAAGSTTDKLKKLDRIELYSKNDGSPELTKTVRFAYEYSLCDNLPNGQSDTTGKLTLTKVWFEYDGIYNAKISPYTFEYEYPSNDYPDKYDALENYGNGLIENPDYSYFLLDPWGNYQRKGGERFDSLKTWVNQYPRDEFDPAAWQLKVIKLPTEGEIHIQYEQDDYSYVQDKEVLGMVSLRASGSNDKDSQIYYLNTKDIGVLSSADKATLVSKINSMYEDGKKKIYFKFLYSLIDTDPALSKCTSEYISGYCNVKYAAVDGSGDVYVKLGRKNFSGRHDLPRKVCIDYVKTQRLGTLNSSGNCDADVVGVGSNSNPEVIAASLLTYLKTKIIPGNSELCKEVEFPLSYLRLPLVHAKKGGGVRVKRLLMYDEGMESGDKALYGSEYVYTMAHPDNGTLISSGVATNEPAAIREENALVEYDDKKKQSLWDKAIAGRDKEQHETPLGESILPGASVGYGKVTIKNIHSGITNTGFAVKEYYTAREYPMENDHTVMDKVKDFLPLPGGLINFFVNNIWTTQGFQFKINGMHGQAKRDATYAGDPDDFANASMSTLQEFTYFEPGEQIPVMGSLNSITLDDMGKETEVVFESRQTRDVSNDLSIEWDAGVGIFLIPIFEASVAPSFTRTVSTLRTHVTSKIVRYPAIQKSVLTYADGIYHRSENLAFNKQTGQPVLTRTTDGYDKLDLQQSTDHNGAYTTYSFPASSEYRSMGQKAKNERLVLEGNASLTIKNDYDATKLLNSLRFSSVDGTSVCDLMGSLYPGDFIRLTRDSFGGAFRGLYYVKDSIVGSNLYLEHHSKFGWFAENGEDLRVEVIRSGRTNQLSTNTGSFTTYGDTVTVDNLSFTNLTDLQALVDTLNNSIASTYFDSIPSSSIGEDLSFVNPLTGDCEKMRDSLHATYGLVTHDGCYSGGVNDTNYFSLIFNNTASDTLDTCCFLKGGYFGINEETLDLLYFDLGNSCHGSSTCIEFCPNPVTTANVVQADAQIYDDNWPFDYDIYPRASGMAWTYYQMGWRGKWRLKENYVYLDTIRGANDGNERNYNDAGTFGLQLFNWADTSANDDTRWIKLNTVTSYSPNGNALEEQDVLGIYSTAKFGYDKTVPYLVAKNADYGSVQFDGFEKTYESNTELEDAWTPASMSTRTTSYAHSGEASWRIPGDVAFEEIDLKPISITQQMLDEGISMKVWIRDTSDIGNNAATAWLRGISDMDVEFSRVARTGEWTLYEAKLTSLDLTFALGEEVTPEIESNYTPTVGGDLWIDDVRLQPMDAQMVTYVYDTETLRLIASFDDQHFGLYYVYNAEGKLVRKLIETEKGVKTITETLYHTPTAQRP